MVPLHRIFPVILNNLKSFVYIKHGIKQDVALLSETKARRNFLGSTVKSHVLGKIELRSEGLSETSKKPVN